MSESAAYINHAELFKRKQEKAMYLSITPYKMCYCGLKLNMKVKICPLCEKEQP